MTISCRQRILDTFRGEKTDRIPVSPFIWLSYVNQFHKSNYQLRDEAVDLKLHEVYRHFGMDSMVRTCTFDLVSPNIAVSGEWQVAVREEATGFNKRTVTTTIRTPERELREIKVFERISQYSEIEAEAEHFIKDEDDFRQFVKYQPAVPQFDCSRIARTKAAIGSEGVVAPWLPSIFNTLSRLRKLDSLICDAIADPDFFNDMMEYYCIRTVQAARQLAAVADIITFEGNIANGSIAGPDYFESYLLPFERRVTEAIRSAGAYVLFHNCGDINNMFEVYNKLGINALETLTPPPYGNADIHHALATLDKDIVILGNIDQIDFLNQAKPEEVEERVADLVRTCKGRGRFILATSDYLEEGTPEKNIRALVNAAVEYGKY